MASGTTASAVDWASRRVASSAGWASGRPATAVDSTTGWGVVLVVDSPKRKGAVLAVGLAKSLVEDLAENLVMASAAGFGKGGPGEEAMVLSRPWRVSTKVRVARRATVVCRSL